MAKRSAHSTSDGGVDALTASVDRGESGDARFSPGAFAEDVLELVAAIPPGRVMTYGDIAAALGSRAARRVGQVMSRYGSDVPWWRVVRAGGHPPLCHEGRALEHYQAESTRIAPAPAGYRVDLATARWSPQTRGGSGSH